MVDRDRFDHKPPDGGWFAWLVVLASAWVNGTVFGTINCFGVIYVYMLDELEGANAFKTSWIGSTCSGLTFMLSPLSSVLTDKFGCRATGLIGGAIASAGMFASSYVTRIEFMYITFGLGLGGGFSIAYTPSMIILGHYFKKRIGLANGLVVTGSAVFTIVLPILLERVLHTFGLRLTLRYMTGMIIISALSALVYTPILPRSTRKSTDTKEPKLSSGRKFSFGRRKSLPRRVSVFNRPVNPFKHIDKSIWKERNYLIWVIALPLGFLGYFVPFFHLVKHLNDILPSANAPLVITCIGATSGIGRLLSGPLSDSPKVNRVVIQQVSLVVIGVVTTLLPITVNFAAVIAAVCVMGLFDGAMVCMMGPIAFDLVGPLRASQGLGFLLGFMSIPMTLGPPIAGWIYDKTGSYEFAFIFAGFPPIVAAVIMLLIKKPQTPKQDNTVPPLVEDYEDVFEDDFVNEDVAMMKKFKREPSVRRPSVRRPSTRSRVDWKPELVEEIGPDGTTAISMEDIPVWQRELLEAGVKLEEKERIPNGDVVKHGNESVPKEGSTPESINELSTHNVEVHNTVNGFVPNGIIHEPNGVISEPNGVISEPNGHVHQTQFEHNGHKKTNGVLSNSKLSRKRTIMSNNVVPHVAGRISSYAKLPEVEADILETTI